jgi:hypothetical protein
MYKLTAKITIKSEKQWQLDTIAEVQVKLDTAALTQTCTLTLPKRIKWEGQTTLPLKRGDAVEVWLGYDGKLTEVFAGYIRDIQPKNPVKIECEDEMYRLKLLKAQPMAYKDATLDRLLADQKTGCTVEVLGEQRLGQYRVTAQTVAGALQDLADNGIRSFFRLADGKPVLTCGVLFDRSSATRHVLKTGVNIVSDRDLQQASADAMRLRVKVISMQPGGKKITAEVGDEDGELRTLHCYGKSKDEAEAWAKQELARLKVDGLTGSVTTFGQEHINLLDEVTIILDGVRKGTYQVKSNTITFGLSGYRQKVELGNKN